MIAVPQEAALVTLVESPLGRTNPHRYHVPDEFDEEPGSPYRQDTLAPRALPVSDESPSPPHVTPPGLGTPPTLVPPPPRPHPTPGFLLALVPAAAALGWIAIPPGTSYVLYFIVLPLVVGPWVSALVCTMRFRTSLSKIRCTVLLLFACVFFPSSSYLATSHAGGNVYRAWTIAVCLWGTIGVTGICAVPLGGEGIRVLRTTGVFVVLSGQLTFSMYFGTVLVPSINIDYLPLVCAMYPFAIRVIQAIMHAFTPELTDCRASRWAATFASQALAAFPYALLFPQLHTWDMWAQIVTVLILFKLLSYLLPISPLGKYLLSLAKIDFQDVPVALQPHNLSIKFCFHQFLDIGNAAFAVGMILMIRGLELSRFGFIVAMPQAAATTIVFQHLASIGIDIAITLLITQLGWRFTGGHFDSIGNGVPLFRELAVPILCIVFASFVTPLVYLQKFDA